MANTIKLKQLDQAQLASFISEMLDGTGAVYTASRAVVTDVLGDITTSSVTSTELGYLSGVSSAVQTQLNAKLGTSLTSAYVYVGNGSNVATGVAISGDISISNAGVTAIGASKVTNSMLAGSIAAAKLVGTDIVTVGTITTGVWNGTAIAVANGGTGATTASTARSALGLVIGTDVAAQSSLASYLPLAGGVMSGLLKFGGSTSSFPALKNSSAVLEVRLADDSSLGELRAAKHYFKNDSTGYGFSTAFSNVVIPGDSTYPVLQMYSDSNDGHPSVVGFGRGGSLAAYFKSVAASGFTITGMPNTPIALRMIDSSGSYLMDSLTVQSGGSVQLGGGNCGGVWIYAHVTPTHGFDILAAKTHDIYQSYADASNYQGARVTVTSTAACFTAITAGTGADNIDILLTPAGTGNVGIGTSSPGAKLDVATNPADNTGIVYGIRSVITGGSNNVNTAGYFEATNASTNYALQTLGNCSFAGNSSHFGTFDLRGNPSSTLGNLFIGDYGSGSYSAGNGGTIVFAGSTVGQNSADSTFAYIKGVKNSSSYNDAAGALVFGTQTSGTNGAVLSTVTEKMRLTAEGRLGIGTGSPASLLHVAGDAKADGSLLVTGVVKAGTNNYISLGEHTQTTGVVNLATNGDATLLLGSNLRLTNGEGGTPRIVSSHGSLSGAAIIIPGAGNTRQGTIEFWTTPTGAVTAGDLFAQTDPRAVITNTGLVGINTTSPVFRLDVGAGSGSYLDAFRIGFALIGGHSGTDYDSIGYNTRPTTSGGLYNYAIADTACRINFYNGGFRFYTAANGTIGAAITETERFTITQGGYVGIGAAIPAERLTVASGNIAITTAGYGLTIKEGSNARMGVATLVGGTVTVATTAVTANSRIYVTGQNLGTITVPVGYAISGRTAGADFTILSANALDTSDVSWMIVEPA